MIFNRLVTLPLFTSIIHPLTSADGLTCGMWHIMHKIIFVIISMCGRANHFVCSVIVRSLDREDDGSGISSCWSAATSNIAKSFRSQVVVLESRPSSLLFKYHATNDVDKSTHYTSDIRADKYVNKSTAN